MNLVFSWRCFGDDDIECSKTCDTGVGRVVSLIFLHKHIGFLRSRSPPRRRYRDHDDDDDNTFDDGDDHEGEMALKL